MLRGTESDLLQSRCNLSKVNTVWRTIRFKLITVLNEQKESNKTGKLFI